MIFVEIIFVETVDSGATTSNVDVVTYLLSEIRTATAGSDVLSFGQNGRRRKMKTDRYNVDSAIGV